MKKLILASLFILMSGCATVQQIGSTVMIPLKAYCGIDEIYKQALRAGFTNGQTYINCPEE